MKPLLLIVCYTLLFNFTKGQNVGIGTTAPTENLEIKNPHRSTVKISSNSYTDTSQLIFSNRDGVFGTDFLITFKQEGGLAFTSKSDLPANTNDSSLIIMATGNVGIGVKAPANKLEVLGNSLINGNLGLGLSPSARLHVNGNAIITNFNSLEFGGGITKEINAGKIGYQTFTADALDIVGAGTSSGNRKIHFWNEGGASFNGPVNVRSTLQLNNNPGTQGQVLTSNGTGNPTWENTALSNTTRFAALGTAGASYSSNLNFTTVYNTNTSDITIGTSAITIHKTGLYHIEGNMAVEADYFPSAAYAPYFYMYMSVNATAIFPQLMNDLMFRDGFVTSGQQRYNFNRPFTVEIYLTAGSVIVFQPVPYPNTATVNFLAYYTLNLRGHLISQ